MKVTTKTTSSSIRNRREAGQGRTDVYFQQVSAGSLPKDWMRAQPVLVHCHVLASNSSGSSSPSLLPDKNGEQCQMFKWLIFFEWQEVDFLVGLQQWWVLVLQHRPSLGLRGSRSGEDELWQEPVLTLLAVRSTRQNPKRVLAFVSFAYYF